MLAKRAAGRLIEGAMVALSTPSRPDFRAAFCWRGRRSSPGGGDKQDHVRLRREARNFARVRRKAEKYQPYAAWAARNLCCGKAISRRTGNKRREIGLAWKGRSSPHRYLGGDRDFEASWYRRAAEGGNWRQLARICHRQLRFKATNGNAYHRQHTHLPAALAWVRIPAFSSGS